MKGYVPIEKYEELQAQNNAILFELEQLKRMVYGAKSERFYGNNQSSEQLDLFGKPPQEEQVLLPTKIIKGHERKVKKKKKPVRLVLPQHLPRIEVIIQPDGLTEDMIKIGEQRSEQLCYVPPVLHVEVTVRPKYARPTSDIEEQEETSPILIAPMPERFIPKSIAHNSLLASILVDKYVDHLPLYRTINRIFRLSGLTLPKATVSGWVKQSAQKLTILYDKLIEIVLKAPYLQVDETRVEVLPNSPPPSDKQKRKSKRNRKLKKKSKRKTERGWYWVYHDPKTKLTFFDYDQSRGANNPVRHLKNYNGTVQSDGLEVYEIIAKLYTHIQHYQCLVHARRKFENALTNDAKRAEHILLIFQQLYAIEEQADEEELTPQQRQVLREQKSRPLLENLFEWIEQEYKKVLPSEPIGQAMAYMIKRKKGLMHFLSDGNLKLDTNLVENALRPVAVGRKNYLFAGSHDAAQWGAIFYSFFACCKVNNIDPYEWLLDVMNRLPEHSILQLEQLLPHLWAKKQM